MKYVQIFLSVQAGKWMIAEALAQMDCVQEAYRRGELVLKAGTTTSCLSWLLTGRHLRLCGRVTARGAVANLRESKDPHTVVLGIGKERSLDGVEREGILALSADAVLVTGANIIDSAGNAALLAGSPGAGSFGAALSAVASEGMRVLIAAGTEKLGLEDVRTAICQARRKGVDAAFGMACGLIPLPGEVITELDAVRMLAPVEAVLIAKGGICGAEGGSILQVWGEEEAVDRIWQTAERCNHYPLSGTRDSLVQCHPGALGCREHLSCGYRSRILTSCTPPGGE